MVSPTFFCTVLITGSIRNLMSIGEQGFSFQNNGFHVHVTQENIRLVNSLLYPLIYDVS